MEIAGQERRHLHAGCPGTNIGRMTTFPQLTTYAQIDLDALDHNVKALKAHIGPSVQLIGVVKANAYGHGAGQVGRAALASGVDRLAVARLDEGIQLRRDGIDAPILVMGYAIPAEIPLFADHQLAATINTLETAQVLSARAGELGRTAIVHIKVDTGMGRYGLLPDEVAAFAGKIGRLPHIRIEGIYTHLSTSDERDKSYVDRQLGLFNDALNSLEQAGIDIPIKHASNSGAILDTPAARFDAVRSGITLYGMYPSDEVTRAVPLRPILSIHSHIGRIRTLPTGATVGYGRTWTASRPTTVALVPIGYGDGYRRSLTNKGLMLIGGQRVPLIGRVSMDQIMADITDLDGVRQDDPVVLLGEQGAEHLTAEDLAMLAGTINYEITTGLLPRLPRVYVRGDSVVEILRSLVIG